MFSKNFFANRFKCLKYTVPDKKQLKMDIVLASV